MNTPSLLTLLLLVLTSTQAQERTEPFDAAAARVRLSGDIQKTGPRFLTKGAGADVVTERFYSKSAIIVTHASGAKKEHPYVAVPLLFRKNSDELVDAVSRENVSKLARLLNELGAAGAKFAIEGHASAEGDAKRNRELSNLRAAKIQSLLRGEGVAAAELVRIEGYGSVHAQHPASAPEELRRKDRRVLVVKER